MNSESKKYQDPSHSITPGLSMGKGRFFSPLFLPKRKFPPCCANGGNCVTASLFLPTAANHPKPFLSCSAMNHPDPLEHQGKLL